MKQVCTVQCIGDISSQSPAAWHDPSQWWPVQQKVHLDHLPGSDSIEDNSSNNTDRNGYDYVVNEHNDVAQDSTWSVNSFWSKGVLQIEKY